MSAGRQLLGGEIIDIDYVGDSLRQRLKLDLFVLADQALGARRGDAHVRLA
jgi:hypothetical protein